MAEREAARFSIARCGWWRRRIVDVNSPPIAAGSNLQLTLSHSPGSRYLALKEVLKAGPRGPWAKAASQILMPLLAR